MLNAPDDRWIKSTANELNNLLQVIADSSELLAGVCRDNPGANAYISILRESVDRAALVTRSLAERVGASITDRITPTSQNDTVKLPSPPLAEPIKSPAIAASQPAAIEICNPDGPREMILVVDDEAFVTLLASEVLSAEGYRVITARDGFQALEIYRQLKDQISLVILDFAMPVMDGADVFAELQQMNPQVAVVLSSGFTEHERLRAMLSRGLRGFIPKPYSIQKLIEQVRQTLDGVQAERR